MKAKLMKAKLMKVMAFFCAFGGILILVEQFAGKELNGDVLILCGIAVLLLSQAEKER